MGRKDKMKRSKAAKKEGLTGSLTKESVMMASEEVKKLQAEYDQAGVSIQALLDHGIPIYFNPNRGEGGLVNVWSSTDIQIQALLDKQEILKKQMIRFNDFIVDFWVERLDKTYGNNKDPPTGGMGGGMAV